MKADLVNELKLYKNIAIWGASGGGRRVLKFLYDFNITPCCFIDSDKHKEGNQLEGAKIYSPSILDKLDMEIDVVIIGSMAQDEIATYLANKKIKYIANVFSLIFKNTSIKYNFSVLNNNLDKIKKVYSYLEDEESKKTFSCYLEYILTKSPLFIHKAKYKQYLHPLVNPERDDVVVDGGAFDGDTACLFLETEPNIKRIYSFEPDSENFEKLRDNCKIEKITSIKMGLWKESKEILFNEGLGLGSYIDEKVGRKIQSISIDDFFLNKNLPDLIKLDIEGSELEALKGAKRIIKNKKPKLQICIYHKPEHLYEIPLFIKSINPNYKLFMGHHTGGVAELVLYAI